MHSEKCSLVFIIDWGISGSVVFHTLLLMSSTTVIWLKFVPSNWLTCYFNKTRQYASQQQCPNCKTSLVLIFYRIWIHKLQYDHVRSLITNYHNYIKFLYILYIIIVDHYLWLVPPTHVSVKGPIGKKNNNFVTPSYFSWGYLHGEYCVHQLSKY